MRPRNREINIFDMNLLNVISKAMAAFLIVMVILMPYYKKEKIDYQTTIARLQQTVQQLQAAQALSADEQTRQALTEAEQQRQRAEGLARQLSKTFLVLYVRWQTRDDVDLHVVDPSGAEFWFQKKTIEGRPGELSEDNILGPGNEVWEIRDAPPGDYRIYVELFTIRDERKPVVVRGRLFHRDGSTPLPEVPLLQAHQRELIATIHVDSGGNVLVR
ncbi:MAG: hypothetical protein WCP34_08295 [Pseudomonadota bacterium]